MPEIAALRGLPGSGKSTLARNMLSVYECVRVNRDDLRKSLFNGEGILEHWEEDMITRIQREVAADALRSGKQVIVDDTNLRSKYLRAWNEFALDQGATFRVIDVDTPVDECVKRDSARERQVGEEVIRELGRRFLRNGQFPEYEPIQREPFEPYHNDIDLPHVVIVDIDGTMALMGDRNPYDWKAVSQDQPNWPVVDIVNDLIGKGIRVVFLSGRDGSCRDETLNWLEKYLMRGFKTRWSLSMRAEGDTRRDDIVKREIFDREIRDQFHVKFVLDDRDQVVKMWRRGLGLTCLQVAEGNF